jgi:Type I phosphodiesterase / nucleotide pyrophosphatase
VRLSRRAFAATAGGTLATVAVGRPAFAIRPRPRLFLLLIAEQFRSDYLDRSEHSLAAGGFRRLMEEGSFFPDCRFYSSTFTANGLATLCSGAYPQLHGIIGETWYDRSLERAVPAAAEALLATTLADCLSAERSQRVFAIGSSLRSSEFISGRSPVQVFHMEPSGQFSARAATNGEWFSKFQSDHSPERYRNETWRAHGALPGAPGLRILKYDAANPDEYAFLYRASPFAQNEQFELLRQLITHESLGQGDSFDFVAVALGATATLGYESGADSPLMQQLVLHLDRQIEATLDHLNKTVGAGNYGVAFTGAHGAPPDPGSRYASMAVSGQTVAQSINARLAALYDTGAARGNYVDHYVYPFLYLRNDFWKKRNINPREIRTAAASEALRLPGVTGYYTADGDCSHSDGWLRRFENSFHISRSGDVMLSYAPEYVEDYGAGRGISYGSIYNYDTRVPLLLYGPQFRAETFENTIEAVDLAPTLARALGVSEPSSAMGRVLGSVFAQPAREHK